MSTATRQEYGRPAVRIHHFDRTLPKVVTVLDNRFVAPGLEVALRGRAHVVGDTAYGAAALALAELVTPAVIVTGELLRDGAIDHFLPHFLRVGAHVLLLVDDLSNERVLGLVAMGLSGTSSSARPLASLADAVIEVAAGGMVLAPSITARIVSQWRATRPVPAHRALDLSRREEEVYNALADGLSTKAIARLLGISAKTVENHRTRVFAKLGVGSQAELVAQRAAEASRASSSPG